MKSDTEISVDGLTLLLAGDDGLVVSGDTITPDWTSSAWTLAGLIVIGCLAVTALVAAVLPVVADLVLGWMPQLLLL